MNKKIILIIGIFICIVAISTLIGGYVKTNNLQKEACEIISKEGLNVTIIKTGIIRNGDICYVIHNGEYIEAIPNIQYIDILVTQYKMVNPGVNSN